jgi:hypothetical protein
LLWPPRQDFGISHAGEGLIRRSDTMMPTDRLDLIVTGLRFAHRELLRDRRGLSCTSKNPRIRSLWACCGNCVSGRTMIATCANPACNVPLRYFRSGKIFMLETNEVGPRSRTDAPKRRIEYFWLCGECAPAMHLMRTTDGAVTICQSPQPSDPLGALRIAPWLRAPKVSGIST